MNHESAAECVFCQAVLQADGPDNLIVVRGKNVFVILNRYPYTSGHLMVVPYAHVASLDDLPEAARTEMLEQANAAMKVLFEEYHPQGFNLGMNLGEAAGAGIVDHIHLHVVPRWAGDTNFMSSVGQVRVLPETLEDTYLRLKNRWQQVIEKPMGE